MDGRDTHAAPTAELAVAERETCVTDPRFRGLRSERGLAIVATLVASLPMIWAMVAYVGRHYVPVGDHAIIDMRIRDAASGHLPLLGMYSRFGWYHPGPALFWSIAPLSLLAGKAAWVTLVGCAALQGVAIVASARVAWRIGGLGLVLATLTVQSLCYVAIIQAQPLLQPWNPYVAYPYLVLFALLTWGVGLGAVRLTPWVVLVGLFLVQLHLGYAFLVAGGFAWCLGVGFVRLHLKKELPAGWRGRAAVSGAVFVAMWIPALLDEARSSGGNLTRVVDFSLHGSSSRSFNFNVVPEKRTGFSVAARVFAAEFHWLPSWLGGSSPTDPRSRQLAAPVGAGYVAIVVFLLLAAFLLAHRTKNRPLRDAVGLLALMSVLATVSLAGLRGELTDFAFYWRISIAVMLVTTAAAAVVTAPRLWRSKSVRVVALVVLSVAIVSASVASTVKVARDDRPLDTISDQAFDITKQLVPLLPKEGGIELIASYSAFTAQVGVFNELARLGARVGVSRLFAQRFFEGAHTLRPAQRRAVWCLVEGPAISSFSQLPGAHLIATVSPLSSANEERARSLQAKLIAQLEAADRSDLIPYLDSIIAARVVADVPGVDVSLAREVAKIMGAMPFGESRYAVYSFPTDEIPSLGLAL